MAADDFDGSKRRARAEKRADRLTKGKEVKPVLKLVQGDSGGFPAVGQKGEGLKVKDLVDTVAAAIGGNKNDLKKTVEAVLEAIGIALATGNDLNVPPLGKLRVAKNQPPVMTLKLRLADGPRAAGLALADEDEDS